MQVAIRTALWLACVGWGVTTKAEFNVVRDGKAAAHIQVDAANTTAAGRETLLDAAHWLAQAIQQSSGAKLEVGETARGDGLPTIILARADVLPEIARGAGLKSQAFDAYAVVAQPQRLYLIGRSEAAVGYAVADVLHRWGFRYYAPSPRWHIVPRTDNLAVDGRHVDEPAMITRKIWYAYGHNGAGLKELSEAHRRWSIANRLTDFNLTQTGHAYGNIIGRNEKEFEAHPEYYAQLPDGSRDSTRPMVARKFCTSNQGLLSLVAADRLRQLEEQKRLNPAAYMVSVDPSDGEGTCLCADCAKLGTPTDRVLHLANYVARELRAKHPEAWVGLYAYSSHRLPPTIAVEPNVYVQVAMGFNRTQYTLTELVELWSKKVGAVGLREYYGVEAWDWGLPGRMRGSRVEYHRKWIPYFAERNVNAINAETNSNWGGQTLGHYVAAQLMWNPSGDVDAIVDDFFRSTFGDAAPTMRQLYAKFDAAPLLRVATLLPMFDDLATAWSQTSDDAIHGRLVDLMAYLVYVSKYRDFELAESRQTSRNDAYYAALRPLMEYGYRIRERDIVHYYALARRLCNGLPLQDGRPDFFLANREAKPVWMTGESFSDMEIRGLFESERKRLQEDKDPTITFTRFLDRIKPAGDDAGPSRLLGSETKLVGRFRHTLRGYLQTATKQTVRLGVAATGRQATVTVYVRDDEPLHHQEVRPQTPDAGTAIGGDGKPNVRLENVEFELPKAGEYRVEIVGDCVLQVPDDAAFVFEASPTQPAWIDYSGPQYFYVPRGTKEIYLDAEPKVGLVPPGAKSKIEINPTNRVPGQMYAVVPVPSGTDGRVWRTTPDTRGRLLFLNIPPLLSLNRETILVPREVVDPSEANSTAADPNSR